MSFDSINRFLIDSQSLYSILIIGLDLSKTDSICISVGVVFSSLKSGLKAVKNFWE